MNSAIDSEFIGWHGKVQEVKGFCKPPMVFPQIYRNYILLLEVILWILNALNHTFYYKIKLICKSHFSLQIKSPIISNSNLNLRIWENALENMLQNPKFGEKKNKHFEERVLTKKSTLILAVISTGQKNASVFK